MTDALTPDSKGEFEIAYFTESAMARFGFQKSVNKKDSDSISKSL
jgi:hypothetical protein